MPGQAYHQAVPEAVLPAAWEPAYPVRSGMALFDARSQWVGSNMYRLRDAADGMHLQPRPFSPAAAPPELVPRRLHPGACTNSPLAFATGRPQPGWKAGGAADYRGESIRLFV